MCERYSFLTSISTSDLFAWENQRHPNEILGFGKLFSLQSGTSLTPNFQKALIRTFLWRAVVHALDSCRKRLQTSVYLGFESKPTGWRPRYALKNRSSNKAFSTDVFGGKRSHDGKGWVDTASLDVQDKPGRGAIPSETPRSQCRVFLVMLEVPRALWDLSG